MDRLEKGEDGTPETMPVTMPAPARIVAVVSSGGAVVPDCTARAAAHEFPGLALVEVGPGLDHRVLPGRPALILFDADDLERGKAPLAPMRSRFAEARCAAIARTDTAGLRTLPALIADGTLCGVLPMNLKLDLWLTVLKLLLDGGDHVPAQLVAAMLDPERRALAGAPAGAGAGFEASHGAFLPAALGAPQALHTFPAFPAGGGAPSPAIADLTDRERQVLELVSRGRRNKAIAAALTLSEHTVKVHLHNIIAKLQVRNRTEAATLFLESERGSAPGGAEWLSKIRPDDPR